MIAKMDFSWLAVILFSILPKEVVPTLKYRSFEYGCIIDAGSSGSRIRIYAWNRRATSSDIPSDLKELSTLKVKPGIASYLNNKAGLKQHLKKLISKGTEHVPVPQQSSTPIYLMATAGMRLLLEDNSNKLIHSIRDILDDHNFNPFNFTRQNARILSGEEEGAFAWVAVNYLKGAFTKPDIKTVGILELGGASTQIAFLHEASILADKYPVRLGARIYNLYVHSYLYYGIDYTTKWIREWLYKQDPGKGTYHDPCILKDDSANVTIFNRSVHIQGSGNYTKCYEIIDKFVYKSPPRCWPKPCAIGTVYQPTISSDLEFYALSAFIFGAKHLQVRDEHNKYSPVLLRDSASKFCGMSVEEAMKFSEETKPEFVSTYCLQGVYGYILFVKGYRMSATEKKITAVDDINGKAPEWTLGALLTEMSKRTCTGPSLAASISDTHGTGGAPKQFQQVATPIVLVLILKRLYH